MINEEVKNKISASLKGRKHSDKRIEAIRHGVRKDPNKLRKRLEKMALSRGAKVFEVINLNTKETLYKGFMLSDVVNLLNCKRDHIKQVLKGTRKTICGGQYTCRYIDFNDLDLENRLKIHRAKRTKACRKYINKDIQNRIKRNLRSRLSSSIRGKRVYKTGSSIENLGCSIEDLKKHLESKFQKGMTWENYGSWHIDHIKPLAAFDLQDTEELKKACHYGNLQPLWAKDNLRKGSRYEIHID